MLRLLRPQQQASPALGTAHEAEGMQDRGQRGPHRQAGHALLQLLQQRLLQLCQLPPHFQPVDRLRPPFAPRLFWHSTGPVKPGTA